MRFKHCQPNEFDERIIRKFLWLPLTLGDETRFFERAYIVQVYIKYKDPFAPPAMWQHLRWATEADIEEYKAEKE